MISPASYFSAWLLTCCSSVTDREKGKTVWWVISSYQRARGARAGEEGEIPSTFCGKNALLIFDLLPL